MGRSAWGEALAALSRGGDWRRAVATLPGVPSLDPAQGDLRGIDLRGVDLRGVDLAFARLDAAQLDEAQLDGADLAHASLDGASLAGASLVRVRAGFVVGRGADLTGADLREAWLEGANLAGAALAGTRLSGARLAGATLGGADLTGADLRGAHLYGVDLDGARLVRARSDADRLRRASPLAARTGFPALAGVVPRAAPLLHLVDTAALVDLVDDRVGRAADPPREVAALLDDPDWRAQLVGVVAALVCPPDAWLDERLWSALDRGSFVSPQLAVAVYLRDPLFVGRAAPLLDPYASPKRAGALAALVDRAGPVEPRARQAVERISALLARGGERSGDFGAARWAELDFGARFAPRWADRAEATVSPRARAAWARARPAYSSR